MKLYIGLDIGGTHIAGGLVDAESGTLMEGSYCRNTLDASGTQDEILDIWTKTLHTVKDKAGEEAVEGIGIAVPGPFDYENGISLIKGLRKYDALYGLNVKERIKKDLRLHEDFPVLFKNDASCFGRGEYWMGAGKNVARIVAITLGTGFGATFLENGEPRYMGEDIPPEGVLYKIPYKGGIAEDYFSSRGILKTYHEISGRHISGVKELYQQAEAGMPEAISVFEAFGYDLMEFMAPWLKSFQADVLVMGGGISNAFKFFLPEMEAFAQKHRINAAIEISKLKEQAAIIGAVAFVKEQSAEEPEEAIRVSGQQVLPLHLEKRSEAGYDLYPVFDLEAGKIQEGWESFCDYISQFRMILIDGYQGVRWSQVASRLKELLYMRGITTCIYLTSEWFLSKNELDTLLAPYLGDANSVWGSRCDKELRDFFLPDKIAACRPAPEVAINIVLGCGASLTSWDAPLIYLEIPKNEIQFRMRAGSVLNLGSQEQHDAMSMYKRSYFVDWIVLNRHKKAILNEIKVLVDCQRPDNPTWIDMEDFKQALQVMSKNVFRARPWFEPGAWGGQWLKHHIKGMAQDEVNYAWSFELITPENGIILESSGLTLEAAFDYLMFFHSKEIIGPAFQERFGDAFPIRFDFLDTIKGGNLSIQCHPSVPYIRKHFGEDFTQDETYYILEAEPNASVYLGFQENINPKAFRDALERSNRDGDKLDIEEFVQRHPAQKHDLFLIPNQTVHSAAAGNLVLEISATPYIFTFKMYDWLRLGLNGKPRPINISHAFNNLDFSRKGERVAQELISHPSEINRGEGWKLIHLPTHSDHFYDVHRYEFTGEVTVETEGSCHVLMLVEGNSVEVETSGGFRQKFYFAETFVIPAAATRYKLMAREGSYLKVVKAFLKAEVAASFLVD